MYNMYVLVVFIAKDRTDKYMLSWSRVYMYVHVNSFMVNLIKSQYKNEVNVLFLQKLATCIGRAHSFKWVSSYVSLKIHSWYIISSHATPTPHLQTRMEHWISRCPWNADNSGFAI